MITAGDGALSLGEVQLEGKRRMSAGEGYSFEVMPAPAPRNGECLNVWEGPSRDLSR